MQMMGHIPEAVAQVFTYLKDHNLISEVTCKIKGYRQPAIGGIWVQGDGIVLPCTYKVYGDIGNEGAVRNKIEAADYEISDLQP